MGYVLMEDFSAGIDLRRSVVTSKPGTLRDLKNGFINAGGQIEKRKQIISLETLPSGTSGLAFLQASDEAVVFGTGTDPGVSSPFTYIKLVPATPGPTVDRVLSVSVFGDDLYIIARMSDASVLHFYSVAGGDGDEIVSSITVTGDTSLSHGSKMYVIDGNILRFSDVDDADEFGGAGAGHGTIDVTRYDAGGVQLVGMAQYYSYLALLGRSSIQLWALDPDPDLNTQVQVLGNIGLVARDAAARYGNGDVLFLADTGIRSLRARDSSNAASLNDIGAPIDELIREKRVALTDADAEEIVALTDPLTGQFWLIWESDIYVLSYYPTSKVSAWSRFEHSIDVEYVTRANSRILFRSGDEVYMYGDEPDSGDPFDFNAALGDDDYDSSECVVEFPFLDNDRPATLKKWTGIDLACEGDWEVYCNPEPQRPTAWVKVATVTQQTYSQCNIPIDFYSTHMALKFVTTGSTAASIGSVALHNDLKEDKN